MHEVGRGAGGSSVREKGPHEDPHSPGLPPVWMDGRLLKAAFPPPVAMEMRVGCPQISSLLLRLVPEVPAVRWAVQPDTPDAVGWALFFLL